jgi:large subunit ribosomal protein L20
MSYSQFMALLKKSGVNLNRKSLADLAYNDPKSFSELLETVKKGG